ncbi:MAG TPA: glycosyltransferase family 4 protein [Oscillatoriales cyanobacterium M4454_W2019_049]|nr:glycosyltransferase family 4 protein [Oscillatoriales cyanobacterium M4454_W2019_049]
MGTTAAIYYNREGYDTGGQRLLGRQAAGEGFLKGLVRYGTAEHLYCQAATRGEFQDFCRRIEPWMPRPRAVRWLPLHQPQALTEAGTLYFPSPGLSPLAWQRQYGDPRSYSLCGVTHTTASTAVMQAVGDLFIAPFQPWDAIVCTSNAVKTWMESLLERWGDYLAQRIGGTPHTEIQLPVIPLGVDCEAFLSGEEAQRVRHQWRQRLGIPPEAIIVLFVGRLIAHAKAHPVPMYLALERVAQSTRQPLYLIQSGWFEFPEHEAAFKQTAAAFCPSVRVGFLDGRQPDLRRSIWYAADILISLADNIQETFGLVPIEAMAAGLPVVVSDWNGYKESVRHGIDGFRVPTLLPPPGCALELGLQHFEGSLNYSTYIGHTASLTAVDVEACTQALKVLVENAELRQQMGENGRRRAREVYDWQGVIAAYEALWAELAQVRSCGDTAGRSRGVPTVSRPQDRSPYPLADDPLRLFSHYPTHTLTDDRQVSWGAMAAPEARRQLGAFAMNQVGAGLRVGEEDLEAILEAIGEGGSRSVAEIVRQLGRSPSSHPHRIYRTIVYLVKFDILRLTHRS